MPARTIRGHLKRGTIKGEQVARHSPWLLPQEEIERLCALLWITPDWEAAELADVAELANSDADTPEAASLAP